ncbi:MAG: hypothetical protein ACP5I8_14455 [Phycisphaerae bacterium]
MADPNEQLSDSPNERSAQLRAKTAQQLKSWEQAVATGDLFVLMTELIANRHPIVTPQMRIVELFNVAYHQAQYDTPALIDQTFQLALAAGAALALQTQVEVEKAMYSMTADLQKKEREQAVEKRLEKWEHVLQHFVNLGAKYAAINHTLALGTRTKQTGSSPAKANCPSITPANPGTAAKATVQTAHSGTGNPTAAAECNPPRPKVNNGGTL